MILDEIVAHKREELASVRAGRSMASVQAGASDAMVARGFKAVLERPGLSVIAEVKRKSPSKGVLNEAVVPEEQGRLYQGAGASAVSVLTDARYFGGSNEDLMAVRAAVDLPVLRKDFTVDEYHVWEARAIGADAILLIVGALAQSQLVEYQQLGRVLGMDVLVEVHDEAELERAVAAGAGLIGINNRNLQTMEVNVATTPRLRPLVPAGVTVVSESGIKTADDVRLVTGAGIDAILVGEALMVGGDPRGTLASFLAVAA